MRTLLSMLLASLLTNVGCSTVDGGPPLCQGDAGGVYPNEAEGACRDIAFAVAAKCDGGLPDGGYWSRVIFAPGGVDQGYCDYALGTCYVPAGIDLAICQEPVDTALASIADAGSCPEADEVRCVWSP